ncbi:MAG: radical SAM family heme chaperone HemW [Chitinophagaceae bacterium]|nr:MAG: radical SAM family heme chaperone HemW [Chitinophagaceae bacterium]
MNGLYIHIPFCKQSCHYCDFHFSVNHALFDQMVNSICKEISLRSSYMPGNELDSVYFGGGTPSLLKKNHYKTLMSAINENFLTENLKEVTLEMNPDDVNADYMKYLFNETFINRISLGVQSFNETELVFMNRSHTAKQSRSSLDAIRKSGFNNISLDLIYGLPEHVEKNWENNITIFLKEDIPHLSAYCLSIEEKTVFGKLLKENKLIPLHDDIAFQEFVTLRNMLFNYKYEHYEISNFALKNYKAFHNSGYWKDMIYLGVGPSAHSFNSRQRSWNIASNKAYIDRLDQNKEFFTEEILDDKARFNEFIMKSLRTIEGINLLELTYNFGEHHTSDLIKKSKKYLSSDLVHISENYICLTEKGLFISDFVAADLFLDN